jgi:hypothetical protein
MATLQAARAYVLGQPIESAKSFGLNRAIFYAAAKRGFKGGKAQGPRSFKIGQKPVPEEKLDDLRTSFKVGHIGDEMAYSVQVEDQELYTIGDEIQTPEEFAKQIERRFEGHFDEAWEEAVALLREYEKGVLLSQRNFYEVIYKPRRDSLASRWTELAKKAGQGEPS